MADLTRSMRNLHFMVLVVLACSLVVGVGCRTTPKGSAYDDVPPPSEGATANLPSGEATSLESQPRKTRDSGSSDLIVTPERALVGEVVSVNEVGRFAVLRFPVGHMPVVGQTLMVYRQGLKVGEVRISGPQRDDHIVADVAKGDCLKGDEVRDQ